MAPVRVPHGGPWVFALAPGSYTYDVDETGEAMLVPDTSAWRPLAPVAGRVTVQVSGGDSVTVTEPRIPPIGTPCDSTPRLAVQAVGIIPHVPASLTAGGSWRDSTTVTACRGPVLATVVTRSVYTVIGDTIAGGPGSPVLLQRVDSISARGEGAEGQHRILLTASGTGTSDIVLDPAMGVVSSVSGTQVMRVEVTTSGRTSTLVQRVQRRATLVTPPR